MQGESAKLPENTTPQEFFPAANVKACENTEFQLSPEARKATGSKVYFQKKQEAIFPEKSKDRENKNVGEGGEEKKVLLKWRPSRVSDNGKTTTKKKYIEKDRRDADE